MLKASLQIEAAPYLLSRGIRKTRTPRHSSMSTDPRRLRAPVQGPGDLLGNRTRLGASFSTAQPANRENFSIDTALNSKTLSLQKEDKVKTLSNKKLWDFNVTAVHQRPS